MGCALVQMSPMDPPCRLPCGAMSIMMEARDQNISMGPTCVQKF